MNLFDPETAKFVDELGGWGAAVVVLIGVVVSVMRGWLVPRYVYDREAKRADALDATLETTIATLQELTQHVDTVIDTAIAEQKPRRGPR